MSDEIFQLMLECWQLDLDERPTFAEIVHRLSEMERQGPTVRIDTSYTHSSLFHCLHFPFQLHINHSLIPGQEYEHFANELELHAS